MQLKDIISKCFRKILRIVTFPNKLNKAKKVIKYIEGLRNDEKELVIVLLKGIGDTVYGLSYIESLQQEYNPGSILVIGNKCLQGIIESYPYVYKCIPYDTTNGEYDNYKAFMDCERVKRIGEHKYIFNTDPYQKCYGSQKNAIELLRTQVFELSEKSKITYPRFNNNTIKLISNIDNKRIVVFNPYSKSVSPIQMDIYEKMIVILKNRGYEVYTNLVRGQEIIKGTKELYCSIDELAMIVEKSAGIVSVRSGILDMVINTGIPIFAMYSNCTEKFKKIYDLNAWNGKSPVEQVYCDTICKNDILNRFECWVDLALN